MPDDPTVRRPVYSFVAGAAAGLFLAAVIFAAVLHHNAGRGGTTSARILTLAHGLEPTHPVHLAFEHFARSVEGLSGGRLKVTLYHSGQLGAEVECIEQVQAGSLDMTKTSASPLESFVPEMAAFSVPYVFRDEAHFWNVLEGAIGQRLLAAGRGSNLIGLCYLDAGSRSFYTVSKPVLTPGDLHGQKIRVQKSKTAMDMVEAMGGLPTPIPWGELYSALQQCMVDGAENNPPSYYSSRHYEVARHLALDEHTRTPDLMLISRQTWERLNEADQQVLQRAAREASVFQRQLWKEKTLECMAALKKAGVNIHEVDAAPFTAATEAMRRQYNGTPLGELLEQIQQVK